MHETLSKNFIGNIDSIKKEGRNYVVEGWIVPLLETNACVVGCEGFVSVSSIERPDIFALHKQQHINFLRSGFKLIVLPEKEILIIKANEEDVFKIEVDLTEHIMTPGLLSSKEMIIVDNFYNNPNSIRDFALSVDHVSVSKDRFNGYRSVKSYTPSWVLNYFEDLLVLKIKEFVSPSGTFLINSSAERNTFNFLDIDYIGVISLFPQTPEEVGLFTYKSKITNLTHFAKQSDAHERKLSIEDLNKNSFKNNFLDKTNLSELDKIHLAFNRLVLLNARRFHSITTSFGSLKTDSLLLHQFFFKINIS